MCPLCGSECLVLLGRLGRLLWLRCRDCGIDLSRTTEDH
jgi:hypothetical protein